MVTGLVLARCVHLGFDLILGTWPFFLSYCPHSLISPFRRIPEILSKVLSIWLDQYLNIFQLCLTTVFVFQLLVLISLVSFPKPHLRLIQPGTHVQSLHFSVCPLIVWQLWFKNHSTSSLQLYSSPPNSCSSTWETPPESQQRGAPGRASGPPTRLSFVFLSPETPALPAV